jgi:ketosteroid isomerase-like protein
MPSENPIQTVLKFEEAINSRNPDAIVALMSADVVFIDSLGTHMQDTAKLRAAWEGYFKMVPDYSISHSQIFADGNTVAVFGSAQGTLVPPNDVHPKDGGKPNNTWKTPAAWRAVVKDGKVTVWQVFADNEPVRAILRKYA